MSAFLQMGPVYLAALAALALAALAFLVRACRVSGLLDLLATGLLSAAFVALTIYLAARWGEAGKPPFQTRFETYVFLAWCIGLTFLALERFYRLPHLGLLSVLGMVVLLALGVVQRDAEIARLPAALRSAWFVPHVLVYFIGYAGLFTAAGAGALFLVRPGLKVTLHRGAEATQLDLAELAERLIRLGFAFLSLGLVMGALWASDAWGDYWTWDPKESWALVSWLIYLIYFHLALTPWWTKKRGALLALLGFAAVIFTYLGMGLLPDDPRNLHTYQ